MKQAGFFDVEERLARLSGPGDQLKVFSRTVDFESFRPDLEKALAYSDGSKGGRPPFDPVLMFRILLIQTLNNLSDEQTEYLGSGPVNLLRRERLCFTGLPMEDEPVSDVFLLSESQMKRIKPFFPLEHGGPAWMTGVF